MIPHPYALILLALLAFRLYRLLAHDVITRPLRVRLVRRAERQGDTYIGTDRKGEKKAYRPTLDEFVHCPWCIGFWVSVAVWAAWYCEPHATLVVSVPFALNAIVGLTTKNGDQ